MFKATPILPAILALALSGYSSADELTDAAEGLCDRIKACALEAVADQGLSEQLRQSMDAVLAKSCNEMRSRVQATPANPDMYRAAAACLDSMASLSCPMLHNMREIQTPECGEYDQLAKAASAAAP